MKTVKTQCASCGGTGLYQGMCEKPNEPVVCLSCNGTGCHEISYEPYTGRKAKRGVKAVHRSRGSFILTGTGSTGEKPMTYAEFCKACPEPKH